MDFAHFGPNAGSILGVVALSKNTPIHACRSYRGRLFHRHERQLSLLGWRLFHGPQTPDSGIGLCLLSLGIPLDRIREKTKGVYDIRICRQFPDFDGLHASLDEHCAAKLFQSLVSKTDSGPSFGPHHQPRAIMRTFRILESCAARSVMGGRRSAYCPANSRA